MTPRPADEARRALRAAKEQAHRDPETASAPRPAERPVGQEETPRPGDVAREALRRAASEHRRGEGPENEAGAADDADLPGDLPGDASKDTQGPAGPDDSGDSGESPARTTSVGAPAVVENQPAAAPEETPAAGDDEGPGPRAADIAREALRAARQDARRAREEAERAGRRARRSRAGERPGAGRQAREHAVGEGARDVRQLLADAFRMPAATDEPDAVHEGPDETGQERPPHAMTDAPHGLAGPTPSTIRPEPPRIRHSMAAPDRDTELRRTFPAFPPRDPDDKGFAESWWGNAWVAALEQGALDVKRLERGRGYAGQGHVDAITVTPGLVLAYVRGSRPRPYRVQVRLRTLDDQDWERFLDAAADRPGHIAALLDKEMPQSLADCGVPLLPGPGDLEPRCSCPDRGHPCKHAAALCYQTARLLDADPFVLLLLRGRGERELLDALSRLSATRAARAAQDRGPAPLPGVRASDVLTPRALPPLPAPLPPPPHPEQPPAYPASPGGPDPFALDQLATDAAARAHALLTTGRDPVGQLTLWEDAVRLAAARPGSGLTAGTRALYSSLASAAGRTPSELARAVAAWRQGGPEGLAVLEEPWDPPAGRFDRARPLLLAADLPAFRPWRNHLTHPHGHVQLRLGRDGLWYAYESEPGHDDWWPRGTPDLDPVGALTGLGMASDL
ncbi:SWIM zinc finger family protein [Streptomyces azureus]|uniref:Zinc finger SWIM domain-containing protein n=1 Tax=Streptomyces azureus TaxID=146537 RepID=A0A0K8PIK4_STRAJ|nr:SWIM zinc finger family protein [Streptomyces azureus]GAP47229.1 zinc finger SWIM domain-containing protein [Streptomyces azureus]